ncbi:MAG: aspartate kinase [Marinilabiliales bacterium]|nr:MAG: aspartate kinase [Marinilabiliales bacterium]
MITISRAVERVLNSKPFILESLNDQIINFSSLASFIKSDIEHLLKKDVKEGAIIMAIRRFKDLNEVGLSGKLEKEIKKLGDIVVRSNLVDFTFKNSESLIKCQQNLFEEIKNNPDVFYTVTRGLYETTFIISDQFLDKIPVLFEGEKLISSSSGLSSITIKLPISNTEQPGLYYYIFKKLAWDGINVFEVVSTSNEITILLKDKDVDRAFTVIKKMK